MTEAAQSTVRSDRRTVGQRSARPLTGETKITDGKIDGDTFTFTEAANYQGMPITFAYTGKMTNADTIELTRVIMDIPEKATAKRVK